MRLKEVNIFLSQWYSIYINLLPRNFDVRKGHCAGQFSKRSYFKQFLASHRTAAGPIEPMSTSATHCWTNPAVSTQVKSLQGEDTLNREKAYFIHWLNASVVLATHTQIAPEQSILSAILFDRFQAKPSITKNRTGGHRVSCLPNAHRSCADFLWVI